MCWRCFECSLSRYSEERANYHQLILREREKPSGVKTEDFYNR